MSNEETANLRWTLDHPTGRGSVKGRDQGAEERGGTGENSSKKILNLYD